MIPMIDYRPFEVDSFPFDRPDAARRFAQEISGAGDVQVVHDEERDEWIVTLPAPVEMRAADLVSEFAQIRVASALSTGPLPAWQHKRLGVVVRELRSRSLLD